MECRQGKLDEAKVSVTLLQRLATGLTQSIFARYSHVRIEWAMGLNRAVTGQVEHISIAYFEDGLVDDVLA